MPEHGSLETDPRFPSGPWTGFFLQPVLPGRHLMELQLTFSQGALTGVGRDWVGEFMIRGRYDLADGKCYWTKRYVGRHDVFYRGAYDGEGSILGRWSIGDYWSGPFALAPIRGESQADVLVEAAGVEVPALHGVVVER